MDPRLLTSLTWPDPIFAQGHDRLQYKHSPQKESVLVHGPDWNQDHHCGVVVN